MLAGMMGQCTSLAHLDLNFNQIEKDGAESLAGVLAQCPAMAHLILSSFNQIGDAGPEALAGVLGQCPTLVYLDLSWNNGIGSETAARRWRYFSGGLWGVVRVGRA
jgi:hypothetical protein